MGLGQCISVLKYVYLLCEVKFQGGVDHLQLYLTVDLRVGGHHIFVYVMVPNLFMGFCLHIFPRNLGTLSSCEALAAGFKKIYSSILDPGFILCCWIPGSCLVLSVVAKWHVKLLGFSMHQLLVSSCRPLFWICLTFVGFPGQERSKQKGP